MMSSLWLVPTQNNPFNKATQELISDTIPSDFSHTLKGNSFIPHVTVTSEIDPQKTYAASGKSAQQWLDELALPDFKKESNEVILELDHLEAGDEFYRKLTIAIKRNENLTKLAAQCRKEAVLKASQGASDETAEKTAREWANTGYSPHLSLLYADLPKEEVKKKIPLVESQIGFGYGDLFACCGGALCLGGDLVIVDTTKPLNEWKPIARRTTPWATWMLGRNLA